MNKNEFLTCLSGKVPYPKEEVEFLMEIVSEIVSDGLKHDGQVRTPFGVFKKVTRKPRRIRDIHSKELRTLPERVDVTFTPSQKIKELIEE